MTLEPGLPAHAEVVVVGGGVIGLSVALALAERGREVVVLEREADPRSASWAGGGILSPLPPMQCPESLRPLLKRSLELYPSWCERLARLSGVDPEYWACGATYIPDLGEPVPLPGLAQVRNPRLLKALRGALSSLGVRLLSPVCVTGWRMGEDALRAVETDRGIVSCAQAVLAAGVWSQALHPVDVKPVKGQMLLFRSSPCALAQILIGDQAYVIPRRDGHLLLGSTLEDAGFDDRTTEVARDRLLREGVLLWPALSQLQPVAQWAGLRPCGPGIAPLLEPAAGCPGLFLATGHHRLGITLAPSSAERIAELMADHAR